MSEPLPTDDFENPVHPHESIWIPLPDGIRLAARLWRPDVSRRVPVVIEYIPYRQSDATAIGDSLMHPWFAGHGIAALRIDIRGSGNSSGVLTDEYLRQEQDDAVAAIAWIAAQPWCNGSVGMIGISWGGFAALQVAARRPPALKAIVTCCSTDDRWRDDVHYMGGALLNDGVSWGSALFGQVARPPDPAHVGEAWRDMWLQRLEATEPPLANWLAHPERDAFWKHGSVAEDYSAIQCAVYAVGGWTDGYSDVVLRLMQHLSCPRRGMIGPWTHVYPNFGLPGPAIGFLQECLRWWRHWLDGVDTGVSEEPMLSLWLGEGLRADARGPDISGRWIAVTDWPRDQGRQPFALTDRHLTVEGDAPAAADLALPLRSPQDCGVAGGEWCPQDGGGNGPEFQSDQRIDDGRSVTFDTPPLTTRVEMLGAATLDCAVAMTGRVSLLAARLCEVAPDGASARVTFGLLRLRRPAAVAPGERFRVSLPLKAVAYAFRPGSRIRLALSDTYWPMAWPEPVDAGLVVYPAGSSLTLPLLGEEDALAPVFGPAVAAMPLPHEMLKPEAHRREVRHDLATATSDYVVDFRRRRIGLGELVMDGHGHEIYRIHTGDPTSAAALLEREFQFERPGWHIRVRAQTSLCRDGRDLRLDSSLTAFENEAQIFDRQWTHRFPYDGD
ncbi:CocE/NonD family hydrolase [Hypericibacter sp.]|uniref:CocE/NonD family hydrolase n=1 Tax=Hypericibacter sp. TaxID=2705401 RepID=UPI003D6D3D52